MLRIEEFEYPNGTTYGVFYLGKYMIGRADKSAEGWHGQHKKKALSAEMAAKSMIDTAIHAARADEIHARKMLAALRDYCDGRLAPDGVATSSLAPTLPTVKVLRKS